MYSILYLVLGILQYIVKLIVHMTTYRQRFKLASLHSELVSVLIVHNVNYASISGARYKGQDPHSWSGMKQQHGTIQPTHHQQGRPGATQTALECTM